MSDSRPLRRVFRQRTAVLRDGLGALIRRAKPRDAVAVIAHVNAIDPEHIHILTERLALTPKEQRAVLRKADGKTVLYLVAVVDGDIVGTADFSRGRQTKNRHMAKELTTVTSVVLPPRPPRDLGVC